MAYLVLIVLVASITVDRLHRTHIQNRTLASKYRLFEIRDYLRESASRGEVNPKNWVFQFLDSSISKTISRINDLNHSYGSVSGRLESINVHAGANEFFIFPNVGAKKVRCRFPAYLEHLAVNSVTSWVTVTGYLTYKRRDAFPTQIKVQSMDVHPPSEDLPTLSDLRGVAPRATGRLKSETFVRKLRGEWR